MMRRVLSGVVQGMYSTDMCSLQFKYKHVQIEFHVSLAYKIVWCHTSVACGSTLMLPVVPHHVACAQRRFCSSSPACLSASFPLSFKHSFQQCNEYLCTVYDHSISNLSFLQLCACLLMTVGLSGWFEERIVWPFSVWFFCSIPLQVQVRFGTQLWFSFSLTVVQ